MEEKEVRVWLNYLDRSLSRRYGRRLPLGLTVPEPKLTEVLKACEALGYKCEAEEKRHPRTWYRPSALVIVRVPSGTSKYEVIRSIGRKLVELRLGAR